MKHTLKIIISCIAGLAFFFYAASSAPLQAAPAGLYFQPGSGSFTQGQEFSVDIYGTAASNFGAPSTNVVVKYPGNLLSVVEVSKTGSAIPAGNLAHNQGQQTVSFTHTVFGVSAGLDNKKLFSIKFRAASPGAASLDFTSTFLAGHTVTKNPSTYTLLAPTCPAGQVGTPPNCSTPPPPTCPAGQVGTPPNCSTPPPPPVTAPPKPTTPTAPSAPTAPTAPTPTPVTPDTSPVPAANEPPEDSSDTTLTVDDIKLVSLYDSASLSWSTNLPAASDLTYGTSASKLDNTAVVSKDDASQKFSVALTRLKPGTKYFYAITTSTDTATPVVDKGSFTTKSYPVVLRVSRDGSALDNAKITLKNFRESYTTNDKGEVSLALNPGDYTLQITKDHLAEEQTFSVKALDFKSGGTPDTQVISIAISAAAQQSTPNILPLILGAIVLSIALGGSIAVILWKRRQSQSDSIGYQSLIDDTPLQQPLASTAPSSYDTTAYATPDYYTTQPNPTPYYTTPAADYTPPAYPQPYQAESFTPPTETEQEPQDMWSAPATPYTTTPPGVSYEAAPAPVQPLTAVESATLDTPVTYSQPLDASIATTSQEYPPFTPEAASPAPQEAAYELHDDNSLTIRH